MKSMAKMAVASWHRRINGNGCVMAYLHLNGAIMAINGVMA